MVYENVLLVYEIGKNAGNISEKGLLISTIS